MPSGTGLVHFSKRHPRIAFDVGIAEEHAALFACGLAVGGMKPFLAIYSTFLQRAYDMIIHDIALQNLNVAFCMDRAGLSGDDGPTSPRPLRYRLPSPGSRVSSTCSQRTRMSSATCFGRWRNYHSGPIAIRYPRGMGTAQEPKQRPMILEIGKAEVLRHGSHVAIIALGTMVEVAVEAAATLEEQGISTAVINARWIQPARCHHHRVLCAGLRGGLHDGGSCPSQRIWLRRDGAPRRAEDYCSSRPGRLADQFIEHGSVADPARNMPSPLRPRWKDRHRSPSRKGIRVQVAAA